MSAHQMANYLPICSLGNKLVHENTGKSGKVYSLWKLITVSDKTDSQHVCGGRMAGTIYSCQNAMCMTLENPVDRLWRILNKKHSSL